MELISHPSICLLSSDGSSWLSKQFSHFIPHSRKKYLGSSSTSSISTSEATQVKGWYIVHWSKELIKKLGRNFLNWVLFWEETVRYEVICYEINSEAFEGHHGPIACECRGNCPLFTHPLWEWRRAKSFRRSRRLSFFVEEEIDSANNPADNAITGALHWVGSEERPIFVCILHEIDLWMDLRHFQ